MPLTPNTRVLIATAAEPEPGRIVRWRKINGDRETMRDWEVVEFASDGARLLVHRSGLAAA
jgi:hypothetical protein